jgi:hypothetical protein
VAAMQAASRLGVPELIAGRLGGQEAVPAVSASALGVACPSLISAGGAAPSWSAGDAAARGLLRRRTTAAAALAAAVTVAIPAGRCQRACRGLPGSSRCAAEDSADATLGATLSCSTWPVRSSRGAPHVRVACTPRVAAALVLLANGFICAATAVSRLAVWLARACLVLVVRDI